MQHLVRLWGMKNAGENSPRVSRFSPSHLTTLASAMASTSTISAPGTTNITSSTTSRSTPTTTSMTASGAWMRSLAMLCTWCTSRADAFDQVMTTVGQNQRSNVTVQVPWEFYIMVIVVIVGVIGLWEAMKSTWTSRVTRLWQLCEHRPAWSWKPSLCHEVNLPGSKSYCAWTLELYQSPRQNSCWNSGLGSVRDGVQGLQDRHQ